MVPVFLLLIHLIIARVRMVLSVNLAVLVRDHFRKNKVTKHESSPIVFLAMIGSCANNPCHYLSTCQNVTMNNTRTYRCICPDYLTGDRCQYMNPCQRQPCFNQGTCIPMGPQNNFMCICPAGFSNYDCSVCKIDIIEEFNQF